MINLTSQFFLNITVPVSELKIAGELRKLFIQLDCFIEILFIQFLPQMLMEFTFFDDFFIHLIFALRTTILLRFLLLFIKSSKIQILMYFFELFIINIWTEVHVIELFQFVYILTSMGESLWYVFLVLKQWKFRSSLGYFDHFICFFSLH